MIWEGIPHNSTGDPLGIWATNGWHPEKLVEIQHKGPKVILTTTIFKCRSF